MNKILFVLIIMLIPFSSRVYALQIYNGEAVSKSTDIEITYTDGTHSILSIPIETRPLTEDESNISINNEQNITHETYKQISFLKNNYNITDEYIKDNLMWKLSPKLSIKDKENEISAMQKVFYMKPLKDTLGHNVYATSFSDNDLIFLNIYTPDKATIKHKSKGSDEDQALAKQKRNDTIRAAVIGLFSH